MRKRLGLVVALATVVVVATAGLFGGASLILRSSHRTGDGLPRVSVWRIRDAIACVPHLPDGSTIQIMTPRGSAGVGPACRVGPASPPLRIAYASR